MYVQYMTHVLSYLKMHTADNPSGIYLLWEPLTVFLPSCFSNLDGGTLLDRLNLPMEVLDHL